MKRETRANLIFISLFLCLTIPGGVILFKKKLDPAAPPMFMPDFVRRRLPYMASQLSPAEQVTRYVPDLTGQWVAELTRQRAGASTVLMEGREPLVSDDHLIQLAAMQHHDAKTTLHFILWDPACTSDPSRYTFTPTAHVTSATSIPMPAAVKKELMNAGVIEPPNAIIWLTAELASVPPKTLKISYQPGEGAAPTVTSIQIPATEESAAN